jgi:Tol biopolymer transport system component
MSHTRWHRIEEIFHGAVDLAPGARSAFLDEACGEDQSLRREVESLLAHESEDGGTFADSPKVIAHYRISGKIGEGGMGAVYRATDTKLGREVAIKVLPRSFAGDEDRMARFTREAKVLATLNHPNIAQIYGLEDGALIMELVPGETLKGPLPLETALNYAKQIAEALEAAHEKGIVHRDLKPSNIVVTPEGVVKLLDFGLAAVAPAGDPMKSPTITMQTTPGTIMGTAAYMSPEQARGTPVDKRADVWSFGVVLYEMITGKRPFHGNDAADTLAAVLRQEPDWEQAPVTVRRLLKSCLQKDPRRRLHDIADVWKLIDDDAPPQAVPAAVARSRVRWLPWAVAAALGVGLAALATVHFRETPPALQSVQLAVEAPPDSTFASLYGGFAPSPDGRYLAISVQAQGASAPSLWLRPLDAIVARQLPGTEEGHFPTWSPDSRSLAFFAKDQMKRIEIAGGAPLILGDAKEGNVSATGTWNRAGVILFGSEAGLERVSASGGGATPLTRIDPAGKETGHGYPQFLPDGNRFLYFVDSADPDVRGVYASSLDHPELRKQILHTSAKAVYVPPRAAYPGYLLWMQGQTLLAQRFDADSLRPEGDPVSVAQGIGLYPNSLIRAAFWASDAGLLTYFAGFAVHRQQSIAWMSRDGKRLGEAAPEGYFRELALAPDTRRMAVAIEQPGPGVHWSIWEREFARGVTIRLTFGSAQDAYPVWSPDGKQLAFSSNREGGSVFQIFRKDASGPGQVERLTEGPTSKLVLDWSKDGKYILYRERPATLMALPLEGDRKPIPVQGQVADAAISPDGRWIAYTSNDSDQSELYVQAFLGAGSKGRWQISNGGVHGVKWRGDGKELYYATAGKIMAAAIQASPQGIQAGTPRVLFSGDFHFDRLHEFDVTPDGQRFLLILDPSTKDAPKRLTVVTNWQAGLRK